MDYCPECGAYWAGCGHWDGPPTPLQQPRTANLDLITEGGTVAGFDLVVDSTTFSGDTASHWTVSTDSVA